MVGQATSTVRDLQAIAGQEHAGAPVDRYVVDGSLPQAFARPGNYEEAAAVLRYASEHGLGVVPWGGGTMMETGNPPTRYDVALDMTRLDAIVEHEPADLTVTCQAGISLGALRELMNRSQQLVPIDPALPGDATVGGVLATRAYGAAAMTYGTPRDFTIGLRVVTADGRIVRAGGKVVKNVAGYDLCKLYIGSYGTLGIIVEATFKVLPLPLVERTVGVSLPSAEAACQVMGEAQRRGLSVRGAEVVVGGAAVGATMTLDLAGTPLAVERTMNEIAELIAVNGGTVGEDEAWVGADDSGPIVSRLSVAPSRVPELIDHLQGSTGCSHAVAYPALGVVRATWQESDSGLRAVREAASRFEAAMVIERCPVEQKGDLDVFGERPQSFALMQQVKKQMDPAGILNPGRFLGGL